MPTQIKLDQIESFSTNGGEELDSTVLDSINTKLTDIRAMMATEKGIDIDDDLDEYMNIDYSGEEFKGFGLIINSGDDHYFILPLRYGTGTAVHNLTIDWGDGNIVTLNGAPGQSGVTTALYGLAHDYPSPNTEYEIRLTGTSYVTSTSSTESTSYLGIGFDGGGSAAYHYSSASNKLKVLGSFGSPDWLIPPQGLYSWSNIYIKDFF